MTAFVSLASADKIHRVASSATLGWLVADHSLLSELAVSTKELARSLRDYRDEPYWSDVLSELRIRAWVLTTTPLRFSHPTIGVQAAVDRLRARRHECRASYPLFLEHLEQLISLLDSVARCHDDPLGDLIKETVAPFLSSKNAILLPSRRYADDVSKAFSKLHPWLTVLTVPELVTREPFRLIIVTGTTRAYRETPFVFAAPRAKTISLVRWSWVSDSFPPDSLLEGGRRTGGRASAAAISNAPRELIELDDFVPAVDWAALGRRVGVVRDTRPQVEAVDSWVYLLSGARSVALPMAGQVLVLDPEAEGDERLRSDVAVEELEPGDYVLLREAGSGDFLVDVANRILGERARELRGKQEHWKRLLRQRISEVGIDAACAELRPAGCTRANVGNVRNWASVRSLKPEDFGPLLRYLGLDSLVDNYARAMDELINSHIRAGFQIRRMILSGIGKANLDPLVVQGEMSFELDGADGGTLTAYRIESRSDEIWQAPISKLGRVVEVGQLWPE